jgi:hypothetical protein
MRKIKKLKIIGMIIKIYKDNNKIYKHKNVLLTHHFILDNHVLY